MKRDPTAFDSYVMDTYRLVGTGKYMPGAITFKGRKRVEVIRWEGKMFDVQRDADAFVREHFLKLGLKQPTEEADLFRVPPNRY